MRQRLEQPLAARAEYRILRAIARPLSDLVVVSVAYDARQGRTEGFATAYRPERVCLGQSYYANWSRAANSRSVAQLTVIVDSPALHHAVIEPSAGMVSPSPDFRDIRQTLDEYRRRIDLRRNGAKYAVAPARHLAIYE